MYFLLQVLLVLSLAAFAFMIAGLFKPWLMLWWEDIQNRRKVIRLYGGIGLVSFTLYLILLYI